VFASSRKARQSRLSPGQEEIFFATGKSSIGIVLVAASRQGVVAILVRDHPDQLVDDLQSCFPLAHFSRGDRESAAQVKVVIAFIENPLGSLDLPLDIRGTAFQRKVWKAVQKVPSGQTSSYSEIARKIGSPKAARAVGSACASCLLGFVIPCHRILRHDSSLSFAGDSGKARQKILLDRESGA
jgi:AraC family transcriptional regulator of adaptative response/methylated-DNA-[protein]-cysteine methyltransferase